MLKLLASALLITLLIASRSAVAFSDYAGLRGEFISAQIPSTDQAAEYFGRTKYRNCFAAAHEDTKHSSWPGFFYREKSVRIRFSEPNPGVFLDHSTGGLIFFTLDQEKNLVSYSNPGITRYWRITSRGTMVAEWVQKAPFTKGSVASITDSEGFIAYGYQECF